MCSWFFVSRVRELVLIFRCTSYQYIMPSYVVAWLESSLITEANFVVFLEYFPLNEFSCTLPLHLRHCPCKFKSERCVKFV